MQWLAGILALLIGIAGWFYLFYSRAAKNLAGVENPNINVRRVIFRRVAGVVLLLLAGTFYAGMTLLDKSSNWTFVAIWGSVLVLLFCIVVLGLIDLRYTIKFYRNRDADHKGSSK